MQYTQISTATAYNDKLYQVLAAAEGQYGPVYLDGTGYATIGTGTLLREERGQLTAEIDATFKLMGFHDSRSDPHASEAVKQIEDGYRARLQTVLNGQYKRPAQQASFYSQIDAIMTERFQDQRLPFQPHPFFGLNEDIDDRGVMTQARAVLDSPGVLSSYERTTTRLFGNVPLSTERVALVTLNYLGVGGVVKAAVGSRTVSSMTRAQLWFAIRYGAMQRMQTWEGYEENKNGWAKRAYMSAALIGLYDTPGQPTSQEARDVFQLLTSNRSFIRDYEAQFGTSFGGAVSSANALGNSATEPKYAAALSAIGKPVAQRLDQELAPAKAKLIATIRAQDPTIPDSVSSISAYDIYVTPGIPDQYRPSMDSITPSTAIDSTNWDSSGRPALLIGGATADILRGGSGNDILIGGDGNDLLEGRGGNDVLLGGKGGDVYVFSDNFGNDVISDLDGQGSIDIQTNGVGSQLPIGEFVSDGLYRSADNSTTYKLTDGPNGTKDLLVSFAGRPDTITIKNWSAARSLGVILMEPPRAGLPSSDGLQFGGSTSLDYTLDDNGVVHGYGTSGNDSLGNSFAMSTTLEGGAGNDWYQTGGSAQCTIYYSRGDGSDLVTYSPYNQYYDLRGGQQDIVLRDLNPSDVTIRIDLSSRALMVEVNGSNDALYLQDVSGVGLLDDPSPPGEGLQSLQFANGDVWSRTDLLIAASQGTEGDDFIAAMRAYDGLNLTIDGGDGNDDITTNADAGGIAEVLGGAGDDHIRAYNVARIEGGTGDDDIITDNGSKEIHFVSGDGVDKLFASDMFYGNTGNVNLNQIFFDGLNSSDVMIASSGSNLYLTFANSGDAFILQNAIDVVDGSWQTIDSVNDSQLPALLHFADVTWTPADLKAAWQRQSEPAADDGGIVSSSGNSNDLFAGTSGSDDFYVSTGILKFGRDSGSDVLHAAIAPNLTDTKIRLKENVASTDLRFERVLDTDTYTTEALKISIAGSDASITINGFFRGGLPSPGFSAANQIEFADGTVWDFSAVMNQYVTQAAQGVSIQLSDNSESIEGAVGADTLQGGVGDDSLDGGAGDDRLGGGQGNDLLVGGSGNDRLEGGQDDDTLIGGSGHDTYVYALGDGNDTILASSQDDGHTGTLQLVDIDPATVKLRRVVDPTYGSPSALQVTMNDGGTIFIQGFFSLDDPTNPSNPIQSISFDDGTQWDAGAIAAGCFVGDDSDDNLVGTVADDMVTGSSGNDFLSGNAGNDTLIGGAGNDTLDGGTGDNVFVFAAGDGVDTIQSLDDGASDRANALVFGDGLASSDATVQIVWDVQSGSYTAVQLSWATTGDSVTINGFLADGDPHSVHNPVQSISFSDGTTWTIADVMTRLPALGSGDDTFVGTSANDVLLDPNGSDYIDAGAGDDIIIDSGSGTNTLLGGDGNDSITFSATASSAIDGGEGDDVIQVDDRFGSTGFNANTLRGGRGNDTFISSGSADSYYFNRGDGEDSIDDLGVSTQVGKGGVPIPAGDDAIVFGEGISASDLSVSRAGDDLLIQIRNSSPKSPDHDSILIRNWNDPAQRIETIQFSDGSTMSSDDLSTLAMTGTDGADAIVAWSDATTVNALSGDDYITSQTPNASIYGGDGNDTIYTTGGNTSVDAGDGDDVLVDTGVDGAQLNGGAGNDDVTFSAAANYAIAGGQGDDHIHVADQFGSNGNFANVIEGGAGNDTIESGASADTYVFSRGDGADTVNDFAGVQGKGVTAGDDMLRFQGDVSYDQIWLQHVGDDLKVSLIGGSDSVTVQNWYADTRNQIETISTGDGYSIAAGQVDALVQAMASFTPPADGQSTLPDDYRTSLAPTLAASWAPPTGP